MIGCWQRVQVVVDAVVSHRKDSWLRVVRRWWVVVARKFAYPVAYAVVNRREAGRFCQPAEWVAVVHLAPVLPAGRPVVTHGRVELRPPVWSAGLWRAWLRLSSVATEEAACEEAPATPVPSTPCSRPPGVSRARGRQP